MPDPLSPVSERADGVSQIGCGTRRPDGKRRRSCRILFRYGLFIAKRGRTVSDIRGYIDAGSVNDMAGGESSARPGSTAVSVPYVSAKEIAFSGKPDSARNLFGGQGRFSRSRDLRYRLSRRRIPVPYIFPGNADRADRLHGRRFLCGLKREGLCPFLAFLKIRCAMRVGIPLLEQRTGGLAARSVRNPYPPGFTGFRASSAPRHAAAGLRTDACIPC